MVDYDEVLKEIYYNPSHPSAYGGIQSLYRALKEDGRLKPNINAIKDWLQQQDTYTLHKLPPRNFKRNRVIVYAVDQQWQGDLADLSSLSRYNKGYKYLLVCIDILSKYAFVIPLKTKKGTEIVSAFKTIFASNRKPRTLQTDKGTEFLNKHFQNFLKEQGVRFFTTGNETKASVVERLNRTLKNKMYRYFTHRSTLKYIDILPQLVQSYNNSYHSSIKRAPSSVHSGNEREVWEVLYNDNIKTDYKFKFKIGDQVRISKSKRKFEKGYLPNFSDEIFTVYKRHMRYPPVYTLKDYNGELLQGTFYEAELQKVVKPADALFRIEKVLKTRKRHGRTQYLVRWQGYSDKFDSWVDNITDIAGK